MSLGWVTRVHFGCPRKPSSQSSRGPAAAGRSAAGVSLQLQKGAAMQATMVWHTGASLHFSPNNKFPIPSLFLLRLHLDQSPELQGLQAGSGMWKCLTAVT